MDTAVKKRDYLFDNYKALLIFLVVLGHFLDLCYNNTPFLYLLKWFIVSFHMPAFLFVSGYFSKKDMPVRIIIQKLLIPYLVFEVIYYVFYTFILHRETGLYLLYPKFSLWYILALFFYRLVSPLLIKIPYHIALTVFSGLLIGLSGMKDNFLSLPRIIVFFPFFLFGLHFKREMLDKFRTPKYQVLSAFCIVSFIIYLALDPVHKIYSPKIFYGRYNYEFLHQSPVEGILIRLLCYIVGFLLMMFTAIVMYDKKSLVSYLGYRTMPVYLFHGLTYSYFKYNTDILQNIDTWTETIFLMLSCMFLVWLFSFQIFQTFTDFISNLSFNKKPKNPKAVN